MANDPEPVDRRVLGARHQIDAWFRAGRVTPRGESDGPGVSRRDFVIGSVAGAGLIGMLAACGESDEATTTLSEIADPDGEVVADPSNDESSDDAFTVVQRFPQQVAVPGVVRLPVSLSTGTAELLQGGPDVLGAQIVDIDGNPIGGPIAATRRDAVPAPYYAFMPTIEAPGVYALVVTGGRSDGAAFQVFEPDEIVVASPGEVLEPFDTPTVDDARGVDPTCTRTPDPCSFHDVTLTDALATGRVVAYYVGTPAFCSTGSCAPGLDSLIEVAPEFADVVFVHAEVYTDDTATTPAPAVQAVGLFYEPALFLTGTNGVIVERLDSVWNTEELRETIARVIG